MTIRVMMEVEIPEAIYEEFLSELEADGLVQCWYYENTTLFLRKEGE